MSLDQATLQALAGFPDALAAHYALFPRSHRNWRPSSWEGIPSEHLAPIEQLCHVRDIEIEGYQKRFHRTLTESHPYLESLDTEQLRRPAVFEGYGTVTLKSLVHYLCSHDQQHLAGLQWLLGQIEAADIANRES